MSYQASSWSYSFRHMRELGKDNKGVQWHIQVDCYQKYLDQKKSRIQKNLSDVYLDIRTNIDTQE